MDFLKSITSTVLSSTGVTTFPFTIGERIPGLEHGSTLWEIKEGTKKVTCLAGPLGGAHA
jgi:SCY1-like protein 1